MGCEAGSRPASSHVRLTRHPWWPGPVGRAGVEHLEWGADRCVGWAQNAGMVESEVDVTERLFAEFEGVHGLSVIVSVVRRCHLDLEGAPPGALPELVERLARQRLSDVASVPTGSGPTTTAGRTA